MILQCTAHSERRRLAMMILALTAMLALLTTGLLSPPPAAASGHGNFKKLVGSVTGILPWDLTELSGLAHCRTTPKMIYAINDKGSDAKVFAVGERAELLQTFPLLEDKNKDWEDLACGRCADSPGECLYIGDIGSNDSSRKKLTIYMLPLPIVMEEGKKGLSAKRTKIKLRYPDGGHNSEALMVHPTQPLLIVATKEKTPAHDRKDPLLYTIDLTGKDLNSGELTMQSAGPVKFMKHLKPGDPTASYWITGGDFHPSGRWFMLMTYTHLFRVDWPLDSKARKRARLPLFSSVDRSQIESIAFHHNGRQFWLASEMNRWSEPLILMELPKEGE